MGWNMMSVTFGRDGVCDPFRVVMCFCGGLSGGVAPGYVISALSGRGTRQGAALKLARECAPFQGGDVVWGVVDGFRGALPPATLSAPFQGAAPIRARHSRS
jgi:hypothetical protein